MTLHAAFGLGECDSDKQSVLRAAYKSAIVRSVVLPESQRLIMYDPHDELEVRSQAGPFVRRIDSRRGNKPKPKLSGRVSVLTSVDPNKFNFTKIKNAEEVLHSLVLNNRRYDMLTNKFPLCTNHMLMVSRELVPQQMNLGHLEAVVELLQGSSLFAYFNSWGAAASVNHLHIHVVDEKPPIMDFALEQGSGVLGYPHLVVKGYPGKCYVLPVKDLYAVGHIVSLMQQENQPHNLFFSSEYVYIFPRSIDPLAKQRSLDIYGEKVGGLEFTGIFTVYSHERYQGLTYEVLCELLRLNSAPLMNSSKLSSSASQASFFSSDASTTDSDDLADDEA